MTDERPAETSVAIADGAAAAPPPWLTALRSYLVAIAVANLLWEFAQLPLFTIWKAGSTGEIIFAAAHCTGGDILIATASLVLALLLWGAGWPAHAARTGASPRSPFSLVLPTRSTASGSTSSCARAGPTRS